MPADLIDLIKFDPEQTLELVDIAKSGKGDLMNFFGASGAIEIPSLFYGHSHPLAIIVINRTSEELCVGEYKSIHGILKAQPSTNLIAAAPSSELGQGSSTMAIWLLGTDAFTETPAAVIKIEAAQCLNHKPCYIAAALWQTQQTSCSISISEQSSCEDYFSENLKQGTTNEAFSIASENCYCAAHSQQSNSGIVTTVID
jgi:hypothetical protein